MDLFPKLRVGDVDLLAIRHESYLRWKAGSKDGMVRYGGGVQRVRRMNGVCEVCVRLVRTFAKLESAEVCAWTVLGGRERRGGRWRCVFR